jgi:hypothetical protein
MTADELKASFTEMGSAGALRRVQHNVTSVPAFIFWFLHKVIEFAAMAMPH